MHIYPAAVLGFVAWAILVIVSADRALAVLTAPLVISAVTLAFCALPPRAVGVLGRAAGRLVQHHVLAVGSILGAVLIVAGRALLA